MIKIFSSVDSSALRFGVDSDNYSDFSANEDDDYVANSDCSSTAECNTSKEKANRSKKGNL